MLRLREQHQLLLRLLCLPGVGLNQGEQFCGFDEAVLEDTAKVDTNFVIIGVAENQAECTKRYPANEKIST